MKRPRATVAAAAWLLSLGAWTLASLGPWAIAGLARAEPAGSSGGAFALGVAPLTGNATQVAPAGPAFFVRSLADPRERREARADILDTPTLPGSIVKAVTLVTALESGAIRADTGAMCRRVVTEDGVRFVCAHPDLGRPLTAAEALAHSCNDFFVSLARRLTRDRVNRTRVAAGLPPLSSSAALAPALVGLDGPRVTPRALLDVLARLTGVGPDPPVPMSASTRAVLLEGLAGAASYGTAAAMGQGGLSAWAKTGTVPLSRGGVAGLVVALVPAGRPTHGVVVVVPGGAGADAAGMVSGVLAEGGTGAKGGTVRSESGRPGAGDRLVSSSPRAPTPSAVSIRLGRTLRDGSVRVESLDLDAYVAEVLAGEGQPQATAAAQQALAITARTFALANRNRHRREGFDLCDSTHCQVVRSATPGTREASVATRGMVLLARGQPAPVFYSASCGGRIERASAVWPGAEDFDHPDTDEACAGEPPWQSEVRAGDVERALRAAGLRGGRLRGLRVLQRNASRRVMRMRAEGFTPAEISGHDFRMAMGRIVGWQLIKSTAFDVERTGAGYRFRGQGFGHGVGLCVIGAGVRASRGASAAEILRFYFPSLAVGPPVSQAGASTVSTPSTDRAPQSNESPSIRASAGALADVSVALPASEEPERQSLVALVRRARDAVASSTGQVAPPALRVTVHPTVESFGRATGQPWWVSGATIGASIDLLSLAVLSRRGILEQTVRHEVAHALLDPALSERPMWVREGAAIHFSRMSGRSDRAQAAAGGGEPSPPSGRVQCPADAEILRPVSAGAQRDAYARAAACFARALASGRSWRDVR